MSDTIIANRYAAALFEAVGGADAADRVRAELSSLAGAVADDSLSRLVANPRVPAADKAQVLTAVGERLGASVKVMNLLRLLLANGRVALLGRVAIAFARLADEAQGRVAVTVTSATPLEGAAKTRVDARVTAILGGKADIRHRVDPAILGGLVVQIGSKVFDNSIRHHLAQLRQAL
ncbi:MAG: ATP synthase F1 subunit delta [Nitrospirae bacterium]|nr:ATP synthase F1 subunit delta [Nitrospirota bacterium]